MKYMSLNPQELTAAQVARWRAILRDNPAYESPFYDPSFTLAVAKCRNDVEVAIASNNGQEVLFLPFQRSSRRVGRPVGWRINDYQGAIAEADANVTAADLLRGCGLSRWHFDHVPSDQAWCQHAAVNLAASPVMDIGEGYQAYLAEKKSQGGSRLKTLLRKGRKLEREVGPLRLVFHADDGQIFDSLLRWKSEQLRENGSLNVISQPWVRNTLEILCKSESPGCQGTLSALYAGEHLVAVHLGLRNQSVLHWWITTYDSQFERYSPGGILLLQLAQKCSEAGIQRIDLGKGSEPYKMNFMTSAVQIAEGAVAVTSWRQARERVAYRLTQTMRDSVWAYPAWKWMKQIRRSILD